MQLSESREKLLEGFLKECSSGLRISLAPEVHGSLLETVSNAHPTSDHQE